MVKPVGNKDIGKLGVKTQFKKGHKGLKKKGTTHLKNKVARDIYADIIGTNIDGKKLTYPQIITELKKLMWKHSMVAKHILEGYFGKPVEKVVQDIQTVHITMDKGIDKDKANTITIDDSDVVKDDTKGILDNNPNNNSNAQSTQE